MGKQIWQVTGTSSDGQRQVITVSTSTREGAIALAAKHGVDNGVPTPVQAALPVGLPTDDELFPPVTIERISFGATVKIGVGVFIGGLLAAFVTAIILNGLGILAR